MARCFIMLALLVSLGSIGCGESDRRVSRARVFGQVTYLGKPVARAMVTFRPTKPGLQAAQSLTDEQGRYRLGTYEKDDGAPIGSCVVAIVCFGKPDASEEEAEEPDGPRAIVHDPRPFRTSGVPLIPIHYMDFATSGLQYEVLPNVDNEFNVELTGEIGEPKSMETPSVAEPPSVDP
jgi:hypothetical protein